MGKRKPRAVDLTGMQFGRLTVIERCGSSNTGQALWRCKCTCGNETIASSSNLKRGHTQSCGCRMKEINSKKKKTHGLTIDKHTRRLYHIWAGMKRRCTDSTWENYEYYGGRGISMCAEWEDVTAFVAWALSSGYADKLSIDRIDNNGDYEPDNCRWITHKEQHRNVHNNRVVKGRLLAEWADDIASCSGENPDIVRQRIYNRLRNGWTEDEALTLPLHTRAYKTRV